MSLKYLIDHQIGFEDTTDIILKQVGLIISNNMVSQMAMAQESGIDPLPYFLQVHTEQSNPMRIFDADEEGITDQDKAPLINISFSGFKENRGNGIKTQNVRGMYYVDCYGYGVTSGNASSWQSGCKLAAAESQRAAEYCRKMIMAATYDYMQMRGTVGYRSITECEQSYLDLKGRSVSGVNQIVVTRLTLEVDYDLTSPQVTPVNIEQCEIKINSRTTGETLCTIDINYKERAEAIADLIDAVIDETQLGFS